MKRSILICIALFAVFALVGLAQQGTQGGAQGTYPPSQHPNQPDRPTNQPDQAIPPEDAPKSNPAGPAGSQPAQTGQQPAQQPAPAPDTSATQGTSSTPPSSEAPKLEVTKHGAAVATFHGTGNGQTKLFHLNAGQATFDVQLAWERPDPSLHGNQGNFSVVLADANHKPVQLVIGTIDYFDGANSVDVPAAGDYMLHITAPGRWNVKIEQ